MKTRNLNVLYLNSVDLEKSKERVSTDLVELTDFNPDIKNEINRAELVIFKGRIIKSRF